MKSDSLDLMETQKEFFELLIAKLKLLEISWKLVKGEDTVTLKILFEE